MAKDVEHISCDYGHLRMLLSEMCLYGLQHFLSGLFLYLSIAFWELFS